MADPWLSMWTIYERPRDHPDGYVARKWDIVPGTSEPVPTMIAFGAPTLEAVRSLLPAGLTRLPRSGGDDPAIVETWL